MKPTKISFQEFLERHHFGGTPWTPKQSANITSKVLEILRYYVADKESSRAYDAVAHRVVPKAGTISFLQNVPFKFLQETSVLAAGMENFQSLFNAFFDRDPGGTLLKSMKWNVTDKVSIAD